MHMRALSSLALMVLAKLHVGCIGVQQRPTMYQSWSDNICEMLYGNIRVDDLSLVVGQPPQKCEPVPNPSPILGIQWRGSPLEVTSVLPGGPADQAGIRAGDIITTVGGQTVLGYEQAKPIVGARVREGQPLQFATTRGNLIVVPRALTSEQCYWDVQAGEVAQTSGSAYVNRSGGAAASSGEARRRFFRMSCRVADGFVYTCNWNWQE